MKTILPIVILILLIGTGVVYLALSPTKAKPPVSAGPTPTQQATTKTGPGADTPQQPKKEGVDAIRAYAALQFNVNEDKVVIVSSEKQNWDDICLGIKIPDYKCTATKTSGYEVVVQAGGYTTTYRGTDDGSIIRIVKK